MMGRRTQLFMRNPDISGLPPFALAQGMALHTHCDRYENSWNKLIERTFGQGYDFNSFIVEKGGFRPEYVLYLSHKDKIIATATAVENSLFPGEGWLRMVGVDPEARGMGAGRLITLAAMHSLAAREYSSIVLSTDDERIPAINLYYSLGFRPIFKDAGHKERWEKIMPQIKCR